MPLTRSRLALLLPLLGLCVVYVAVKQLEPFAQWGRHAFVDAIWAVFSAGATLACVWTARRAEAANVRQAWWLFGAGCAAWFLGIVEWSRLELIRGELTPFPSWADVGFLALPVCFVGGMACLRRERRTRSLSLLQASSVGLVVTGTSLVIALALAPSLAASEGSRLVFLIVGANVLLFTVDFLFGLYCLLLAARDRNPRRVLLPIVVGQGCNWLVVVAYLRALLDQTYTVGGWLDVAFCLLFGLVMLAAQEQHLQAAAPVAPPLPEPRLAAVDAFFPALALGLCVLAAVPFADGWSQAAPSLLALHGVGFSAALGLHALASRRLLQDLERTLGEAEARAREAQGLESLSTLASGLAHDFNNVLTVIKGQTDILRFSPGDTESLDAMAAAIDQGRKLTQSLHGLTRREAHRREEADVRRLVSAVRRLLASTLPEQVTVRVEVDPDLPPVQVAAGQLQHALLNLALNARDAMPRGGELTFGARRVGDRLELFVRDTGHGVPPDLQPRVFEPFFTTKPAGKGRGLGLAMVAQAAKDHGGEVRVASSGAGTTFVLSLPLVTAAPPAPSPPAEPASAGPRRILVVDDDPLVRRLVADVLTSHGWQVVQATDVAAAQARVSVEPTLRAVVTDVDMPGGSGLDLAAQLQREHPALPVILMSGHDELDDPRAEAAYALFHKPLDVHRLARAIAELPTAGV